MFRFALILFSDLISPVMDGNWLLFCVPGQIQTHHLRPEGRGRSREVHAVFLKSSQSTWQLPQIFPFSPWYLDGLWLSLLFVCPCVFVCVCACALQIPLSCLPCPGLVRWGERLHLSLPPRVQSLVSRTLLRAHVHPLHPGEMNTKTKRGQVKLRWKSLHGIKTWYFWFYCINFMGVQC